MRNQLLKNIGNTVIGMVQQNIAAGRDKDGNSFQYSDKPFYMPYNRAVRAKLGKDQEGKLYNIVTSKRTGKLGMIILCGYANYKAKVRPNAEGKFLQWTGKMLRNMNITDISDDTVTIGFPDPVQSQKAFWFNVSGVGKSRKLWKFFGLSAEQKKELAKMYEDAIIKDFLNIKTK